MPPAVEGQITMEKTPSYFITAEAPHRVQHMNPGSKLIVVVRDPVTRAISDYTQVSINNYLFPHLLKVLIYYIVFNENIIIKVVSLFS